MNPPPRYLPDRPLPPYTYVPGQAPHPIRDPQGHMHGHDPGPASLTDDWRDCEDYLWGIDLFNHGYYWEAHEAWEGLWHAAGRKGPQADFLKGLIKLAAAGVKFLEGSDVGFERHRRRAIELLDASRFEWTDCLRGTSPRVMTVEDVRGIGESAALVPSPVVRIMPFTLFPIAEPPRGPT